MKKISTIGVVGSRGMVGSNTYRWFKKQGYKVFGYSNTKREEETLVNSSDLIFICVPTPYRWNGKGFDASIIDGALKSIKDGAMVIIKSTIIIGTTNKFQKKYPHLKLMFNPEFLSEDTCWTDFINPDRQFLGYTKESYSVATQVLHTLPQSPYDIILPVKEAELLKYINNLHGVLEVMESNHYYDVCQKEGLDYKRIVKAMVSSKWVGCPMSRHYRTIFHKGKRGVGGKCFPKDLNAWLDYCKALGVNTKLFQAARDYNFDLLKDQGLDEEMAEQISSKEDFEKMKEKV